MLSGTTTKHMSTECFMCALRSNQTQMHKRFGMRRRNNANACKLVLVVMHKVRRHRSQVQINHEKINCFGKILIALFSLSFADIQ